MPRGHCSNLCETCPMSGMVSLYFDPENLNPDNLAEGLIDEANFKGIGLKEAAHGIIEEEFYGESPKVQRAIGNCILKVAQGECTVSKPRNRLSTDESLELPSIGDNEMAQGVLSALLDSNLDMSSDTVQRLRQALSEIVADSPKDVRAVLSASPENVVMLTITMLQYMHDN